MKNTLTILLLCCASLLFSQNAVDKAATHHTASIDQIVQTLYDVISGPAGARDWDQFNSLFYPDAFMGAVRTDTAGATALRKMSPAEYIRLNGEMFLKNAFYERELHRRVMQYGNMAQVYSAYELELHTASGVLKRRGLNSIQLLFENNRWWVMSLVWEEEKPDWPLDEQGGELTKIIVVRHAEKANDGTSDPPLSEAGLQRAAKLNRMLSDLKIDRLYSTFYKRNVQTLAPLAEAQKVEIVTYEAHDKTLAARILESDRGKTIVISGHSNTVPGLVNAWLGHNKYADLPDSEYSKIWILTFNGKELLDCSELNF
ncbi:MAG: histidine phosphatase family protein [Saprospiraceae bacterium]|nr:histidine phosphatase family protein [Saprospiraceae bacterium]